MSKMLSEQELAETFRQIADPEECGQWIERLRAHIAALAEQLENLRQGGIGGGCTLAGPGQGDCEHFVGLPGRSVPGQHDGPDDTVDVYGKPNGWCWSCWRSHQLAAQAEQLKKASDTLVRLHDYGIDTRNFGDGDASALWDRIDEFRGDENATLSPDDVRALAEWWAELHESLCDLDDKYVAADEAREQAVADNAMLLLTLQHEATCTCGERPADLNDVNEPPCGYCQAMSEKHPGRALLTERNALAKQLKKAEADDRASCLEEEEHRGALQKIAPKHYDSQTGEELGIFTLIEKIGKEQEKLKADLAEATTQLSAWHKMFGTTQLTHALAERDALAELVEKYRRDLLGQQDEVEDVKAELTRRAERIAALEKVVNHLPRTRDGVLFAEYEPEAGAHGLWCLWRYEESEPWRAGACHVPDRDEWDLCFDFVVEDTEDECEFLGPYSTREAAEEALAALDQKGEPDGNMPTL